MYVKSCTSKLNRPSSWNHFNVFFNDANMGLIELFFNYITGVPVVLINAHK